MSVLFTLETPHLMLRWSRRREKPVPVEPGEASLPFGLVVHPAQRRTAPTVHIEAGVGRHLFEETDYTLFVQSKTGRPVQVRHRDPVLMQGLHRTGEGGIIHGTVNFGSQVGA